MSDAQHRPSATIERWAIPKVEGPVAGRKRAERAAKSDEGANGEEEARGYEAGIARAQAEINIRLKELDTRVQKLAEVLQHLAQPLKALDAEVEEELLLLALAVGQQLTRRELQADPAQIVAVVRECLEQLPLGARDVRVQLHPEDAACVRERLAAPTEQRAWTLVDDPTLARGGCIVLSDVSKIDARLESRLNAIAATALGEARAPERSAAVKGKAGKAK
jgi:flagellar assembly protein FliH